MSLHFYKLCAESLGNWAVAMETLYLYLIERENPFFLSFFLSFLPSLNCVIQLL